MPVAAGELTGGGFGGAFGWGPISGAGGTTGTLETSGTRGRRALALRSGEQHSLKLAFREHAFPFLSVPLSLRSQCLCVITPCLHSAFFTPLGAHVKLSVNLRSLTPMPQVWVICEGISASSLMQAARIFYRKVRVCHGSV